MRLSDHDTERAAWHLGMNQGAQVPAGDMARFYEATRRIPSAHWYERIIEHLNRCDRAWAASEVVANVAETGQLAPSRTQRIFGDANRSVEISDPLNADQQYREIYLREVDRLAETLYVPNYRRESTQRFAFSRSGAEFINALPGPADTSVGTRVLETVGGMEWA